MNVSRERARAVAIAGGLVAVGVVLEGIAASVFLNAGANDGILVFLPYVVATVGLLLLAGGGVAAASTLR